MIGGRKHSWANDEARKKRASIRFRKQKEKTYKLRNPDDKIVTITNMQDFCSRSDVILVPQLMSKVARGLLENYKGWTKP